MIWKLAEFEQDLTCLRDAEIAGTVPFDSRLSSRAAGLSFAIAARYLDAALANPAISAVIVPSELAERALASDKGVATHSDPRGVFFRLHNQLAKAMTATLPPAEIAPDAEVSPRAVIGDGAVIGPGCIIEDFAWLAPGTILGRDVYIGQGTMIGSAGHFELMHEGRRHRVAHAGRIRIGDHTQVLAGAIIQANAYGVISEIGADVVIGPGAKLGHGVEIGSETVVTGGAMIAGYTRLGARVWVGPGAVIGNRLAVGDSARIEIGAVVVQNVGAGCQVSGNFAGDHKQTLRDWARRRGL